MAQAPAPFWTREVLSGLVFDDNRELYDHLKIEALRAGFDIASRQPLRNPYGVFYCTKGGRVKRNKTSKCGCTFGFKTTLGQDGKTHIRIDESLELEHNHELHIGLYAHRVLAEDTTKTINDLHTAGIKPMQIKTFLDQKGQHLSTLQIQYVIRRAEVATFQAESEDLIRYVNREPQALTRVFEREIDGELHRFAVLTFTERELANLKKYGDVLFIDGTMSQLRLRWEILPITGVDQHRELVSCGIMYASVTNEEVLTWLLAELWRILGPLDILRSIITDEDAAFAAAFESMVKGINEDADHHIVVKHVLCALHKQRNFTQKLQKCGLSHEQRVQAVELFRSICYHTNNAYAEHCLEQLKGMNAKLRKYIEERVVGTLPQFARSYMNGVYSNGYNTTSPGESMNNLLKQGVTSLMTLRESREHFDEILRNHDENCALRHLRRQFPVNQEGFMPVCLYRQLGAKMAAKLSKQTASAEFIMVEEIEDPQYTHKAWHRDHDDICYRLNETDCECNTLSFLGIPCSHLIRLYMDQGKEFPMELINERWRIDEIPDGDPPSDSPEEEEDDEGAPWEDLERELAQGLEEEDQESDLPDDAHLNPKQLYLRMFHLGKNIASKACNDEETATRITAKLRDLLAELIELPPEVLPNDTTELVSGANSGNEVVDVVDHTARPRGRPKKIRNSRGHFTKKHVICKICGFDHEMKDCIAWDRVCEAVEEFRDYSGPKRRCRICTEPGHNARTCPIRLDAQKYYEGSDDE